MAASKDRAFDIRSGISFGENAYMFEGNVDPTTAFTNYNNPGPGSIYIQYGGTGSPQVAFKTGALVSNWTVFQTGAAAASLQTAYTNGSLVNVTGNNVQWQLTSGKSFNITDSAGTGSILSITGGATQGGFALTGNQASSVQVASSTLTIGVTGTGGTLVLSSTGSLTLDDQYLTAAIPLSQSGTTGLSAVYTGAGITSIIGALNYAAAGAFVPLVSGTAKVSNLSSLPPAVVGGIAIVNNTLFSYDNSRSKWLSTSVISQCAKAGTSRGYYLIWGPGAPSYGGQSGLCCHRNGTIVGAAINTTTTGAPAVGMTASILINGSVVSTLTFDTSGDVISTTLNVDFVAHDVITVRMGYGATDMLNPIAFLEYCWRA